MDSTLRPLLRAEALIAVALAEDAPGCGTRSQDRPDGGVRAGGGRFRHIADA
jgi:hypothetical protein